MCVKSMGTQKQPIKESRNLLTNCQKLRFVSQRMLTDQPVNALLDSLFDVLADAAVYLEAVRDERRELVDFRVAQGNHKGSTLIAQGLFGATLGECLLGDDPDRRSRLQPVFRPYANLLLTGETQAFTRPDPLQHRSRHITQSRLGDGVLVVVRDADPLPGGEPTGPAQPPLLNDILDASLNGIITGEAVYDWQNAIVDFRLVRLNQAARQLLNLTAELAGKSMRSALPGIQEAGLFALFTEVVKTGQPARFETPFSVGDQPLWVDMSVVKLGDGLVVTFNDITAGRQAALAAERAATRSRQQAELLNGVLNNSPSGIKAMEAVRDEEGNLVDFTVTVINKAGADVRGRPLSEIVGQPALRVFPGLREAGLFEHYTEVVESRQSRHIQVLYGSVWYNMAIAPFGDGVIVTYTDISESMAARQAIEQQAHFLNSVLDSSSNGIVAERAIRNQDNVIVDFLILSANQQAAVIVGSTVEDLVGHGDLELHPNLKEAGLFDTYVRTVETGLPQSIETHYNDGRLDHWLLINTRKLDTDELVVTFLNNSDAKRTQQALERAADANKRQAELLNSVLNSSNSGVMAFEAIRADGSLFNSISDFRFLVVNRTAVEMVGRTMEDMLGNTLLTVFPGNRETGLFDLYVRTTETGEPGRTEVYYNHDGLDFWLQISAEKLGDGFVVTFADQSVVKRASQVIEQSAAELQTVIDTSQTGIFLFSPVADEAGEISDFRFRVANRQLAAYVGQKPAAVVGALGSTWFPGYKTNGLFDLYHKTYVTGQPQRFDFHYNSDGIDVWLDILSTKIGNEVLVTFGDYTPLKRLQQQLESSVVDLQRSNRNLEQFAYVASHDLQEPLRKIQQFGDIIQTQYTPIIGREGADMIRRMQQAAARMQVLIKDVLAYSRVATKREETGPVDLNTVVGEVLTDLETVITDKEAVVDMAFLPVVSGDAPQLRQLFQNLISNALKFTKPGQVPQVRLTGQSLEGRSADVRMLPGDADRRFWLIEISDNGIGFEPHQADRIFQVFQRLHGRSHYEGTGIGLAIVQKVVENHGGYIRAEGRPGQGATFGIYLPA